MVWSKNENYWGKDNTKLDTINWYLVAEDSTAATMFENGELDVLQTSGDYSRKYKEKAEAGRAAVDYSRLSGNCSIWHLILRITENPV